jgi:hypothetical protein
MKKLRSSFILAYILLNLFSEAHGSCVVAIPDDCPIEQVCAKFNEKAESKCFDIPKIAPIIFDLPFDSSSEVICAQSGRFSSATHIYRNMLYAIDLATPYSKPASTVHASEEGKAFIHEGCPDPSGTPDKTKTDSCGGGYISLYAHLSKIIVRNGQTVKKQQVLGTEGATGQAAYRHLH